MAYEFKMPMVAESVVEGEIGRWLVKVGDFVKRDQPLVEVLTDKVNVEIPSPYEGYLLRIDAPEGRVAKIGELLAILGDKGEPVTQPSVTLSQASPMPEKSSIPLSPSPKEEVRIVIQPSSKTPPPLEKTISEPGSVPDSAVKAMPKVRQLAKELGIDLALVRGTGKDGMITEEDVTAFKEGKSLHAPSVSSERTRSRAVVEPPGERVERAAFKGVRRIVAVNMRKSLDSVAQTLHVDEADVTDLVALREVEKRKADEKGIKLTYLPFFIKAIVAALKKHPYVNASLDEEAAEIVLKYYYNIGIATNTDQGLVVPVLKDADKKDIWQLASEIATLAEKARTGRLTLDEVQDSTFSITNIGSMRGQISFPVINLPNAAIIGIQSITKRPVVKNGEIVIRDMVNLSLAFDHRIFDGATASSFTTEIIRRVETPALLFWDEG